MKLIEFARRWRWWLAGALLVYLVLSVWLFRATQNAQDQPFVYLVF